MRILISKDPASLVVKSEGMTELEKYYVEEYSFPYIEVKEIAGGYKLRGKEKYLFDALYKLSQHFDIELT